MLNILIIEDNVDHFFQIEETFTQILDSRFSLNHDIELSNGLNSLQNGVFDIALCDLQFPDSSIEETLEKLKQLNTKTPIIVLTSLSDMDIGTDLLKYGIQDFLPKDELSPTLLHRMCVYAIERKQQELELQRENADMQTFCESLSHDFKGHIRRISKISEVLHEELSERIELSQQDVEWFEHIEHSTAAIKELVDSLSQFLSVNHSEGKNTLINLSELFLKVQGLIDDTHNDAILWKLQETYPVIQGNAAQLFILFHNLISNGIKYNENVPQIEITTKIDKSSNRCLISVTDNGYGIDEVYFSRIFKPFARLQVSEQHSGSGLGLSIVKRIIEQHYGEISLDSTVGKGSTFTVKLPMHSTRDSLQ